MSAGIDDLFRQYERNKMVKKKIKEIVSKEISRISQRAKDRLENEAFQKANAQTKREMMLKKFRGGKVSHKSKPRGYSMFNEAAVRRLG